MLIILPEAALIYLIAPNLPTLQDICRTLEHESHPGAPPAKERNMMIIHCLHFPPFD
jgi:hypothetical protein